MTAGPTRPETVARTRRRAPVWVLALASAAVVLSACSGSSDHATPTTSPASTTTVPAISASPPGPSSPYSWQRSQSKTLDVGGGAGTTVSSVLAPEDASGWDIFGTVTSADGTPTATEWTSPGGRTWTRATLPTTTPATTTPATTTAVGSQAEAAADYRGKTVVVGSVGQGVHERAAAWVSAQPGEPFVEEPVPDTDGPSSMTSVAVGPLGIFAIGEVDGQFALWSSSTGTNWSEQPTAERAIEALPGTHVNTIVAFGDSIYAAGSVQPGAYEQAALWTTWNGISWRQVGYSQTSFKSAGDNNVIYSLAELGTGLVAVGGVNNGTGWEAASWISPDGISWSPASSDFPGAHRPSRAQARSDPWAGTTVDSVSSIATSVGPTSVVATGGGPYGQGVWESDDGLHWTSLSLPAADASSTSWEPGAVAATTTSAVVLDTDPGTPYVLSASGSTWTQPSSDPAVFGAVRPSARVVSLEETGGELVLRADVTTPPQTIGTARSSEVVLTSADGTDWVTDQHPVPSGTPSGAVTAPLAGGWVAVGPAGDGVLTAWTYSGDGVWKASGTLDTQAAASQAAVALGACATPSGAAVVGAASTAASTSSPTTTRTSSSGSSVADTPGRTATAWYTADGRTWRKAQVSPLPATDATELMTGCTEAVATARAGSSRTSFEVVAFGTGASTSGAPEPGLWRSTNGTTWTRFATSGFTAGSPNPDADLPDPLVSLAASSSDWLAVAGSQPQPGQDSSASVQEDTSGLWLSTDSGSTWQLLDLAESPWLGNQETTLGTVAFLGGTAVVAGTVDGRLAVWTGTTTSRSAESAGSQGSAGS